MVSKMGNMILLGFHTSDQVRRELDKLDKRSSAQTYNYHTKISKCLVKNFNVKFISSYPVSDYPICTILFSRSKKEAINSKFDVTYIPFINHSLLKLVTRLASSLYYLILEFFVKRNSTDYLVVYSVHVPYLISAFIMSKITGVETVSIWTDPPAERNEKDSKIKSYLRGVELYISRRLMSKFDKSIVISKQLATSFNPGKPFFVLDSIFYGLPKEQPIFPKVETLNLVDRGNLIFSYTGGISKKYGLDIMLEAFSELPNNFILNIYGTGDDVDYLINRIKNSNNVFYHGLVTIEGAQQVQSNSDFLLNIRDSSQDFVNYSYPSKLTEYIYSETPIISSKLKGIPDDHFEILIPFESNNACELKRLIHDCSLMSESDKNKLKMKTRVFINERHIDNRADQLLSFLQNKDDK